MLGAIERAINELWKICDESGGTYSIPGAARAELEQVRAVIQEAKQIADDDHYRKNYEELSAALAALEKQA